MLIAAYGAESVFPAMRPGGAIDSTLRLCLSSAFLETKFWRSHILPGETK